MVTVNISLPDKLKKQVDELVKEGYYVSFSDAVRTALRALLEKYYYPDTTIRKPLRKIKLH